MDGVVLSGEGCNILNFGPNTYKHVPINYDNYLDVLFFIYIGSETPLLWREIPMAWGTTIDILTPEINHFQYAREIKYMTLKDQNSYLIPND